MQFQQFRYNGSPNIAVEKRLQGKLDNVSVTILVIGMELSVSRGDNANQVFHITIKFVIVENGIIGQCYSGLLDRSERMIRCVEGGYDVRHILSLMGSVLAAA